MHPTPVSEWMIRKLKKLNQDSSLIWPRSASLISLTQSKSIGSHCPKSFAPEMAKSTAKIQKWTTNVFMITNHQRKSLLVRTWQTTWKTLVSPLSCPLSTCRTPKCFLATPATTSSWSISLSLSLMNSRLRSITLMAPKTGRLSGKLTLTWVMGSYSGCWSESNRRSSKLMRST